MPLTLYEIIGYIGIFINAGLFQAAGMGGGELIVSYMLVIFRFDTKEAIFLTYAIMLGGAIGRFIFTSRERFGDTRRPIINYDLASLIIPCLLIGTLIGGVIKMMLPDLMILVVLSLLLILAIGKIGQKAH